MTSDDNIFQQTKNNFSTCSHMPSDLILDGCCGPNPLVSIVIPTFRRPELLRQAIASAVDQVATVFFEVVVVDNEQDPQWSELVDIVCKSFLPTNIRLYRNRQNLGMFGNWNRGIELARGEWLTILNDDDLLLPGFVEDAWLSRNGDAMILGNTVKLSSVESYVASFFGEKKVSYLFLDEWIVGNPTPGLLGALISKEVAVSLGGYDEGFWPASDYVFNSKYWLKCGAYKVNREFAIYRWSVNESQKVETLNGFLSSSVKIRSDLLDYVGCLGVRRIIANFLLKKQSTYTAMVACVAVNSDFDPKYALSKLSLNGNAFFYELIKKFRKVDKVVSIMRLIKSSLWALVLRRGGRGN